MRLASFFYRTSIPHHCVSSFAPRSRGLFASGEKDVSRLVKMSRWYETKKASSMSWLSFVWWRGTDSNHRRQCRQIYSLLPLATREPLQGIFILRKGFPNTFSKCFSQSIQRMITRRNMVEGDGFEPSKAVPADLQSAPFGHSGTPPGYFYT